MNYFYSYYWSHIHFHNSFWNSSKACLWSRNFFYLYRFLYFLSGTYAFRTKWSPWANGKNEIKSKQLSRYFRCYLSEAGNNWAKLTCQFAFALSTSVNSSTGTTPYEMVFGFEPQTPVPLEMGPVRDDNDLCQSEVCQILSNHTHLNKETSHSCIDKLKSSKSSMDSTNRERQFKNIYRKVYRKIRDANHRSLSYWNKYKLAKPLRVGQKTFRKMIMFRLEKHKFFSNSEVDRTLWLKYIRRLITRLLSSGPSGPSCPSQSRNWKFFSWQWVT